MKLRPTQFGVRENAASSRRHASRRSVLPSKIGSASPITDAHSQVSSLPTSSQRSEASILVDAAAENAATGGEEDVVVERPALTASGRLSNRSRDDFEPLMGSVEAAKLLGNIHVKTLQRYARQGSLPGYQIGGHWYFRASQLDTWLRLRINSTRQSVRAN